MRVPYPDQALSPQPVADTFPAQSGKAFTPCFDQGLSTFLQWWRDPEIVLLINRRFDDVKQRKPGTKWLCNRDGKIQGAQRTIGKVDRDKNLLQHESGATAR